MHQLRKEGWLDMWGLAVVVALYLYVRFAMWVVKKLADKRESKQWKWGVRVGVTLVFVLIPTGDSIVGHLYLNHLCRTEAGVKVYQTVELPAEYWDEQGRPRFYVNQYEHNKLRYIFPDKTMIDAPQFQYTWVTKPYSEFLHIEKDVLQIADRKQNRTFGEYFLFRYWGGWVVRNFSPHNTATSCEVKDLDNWSLNIFKPATSTL